MIGSKPAELKESLECQTDAEATHYFWLIDQLNADTRSPWYVQKQGTRFAAVYKRNHVGLFDTQRQALDAVLTKAGLI